MADYISPTYIDKNLADSAQNEVLDAVRQTNPQLLTNTFLSQPFFTVPHTDMTKRISDDYIQGHGPVDAAHILGVNPEQASVFGDPTVIVYVKFNNPSNQSVGKTTSRKAITILSLGDLDRSRGLPGIGDPPQWHKLISGQVLRVPGHARQTFNANPEAMEKPGIAILTLWIPSTDAEAVSERTG